ncbi:hypothetical protein CS0771_47420 [Catellatospora sp. IY07-71]|nr:hypothetical protein [Catellatospora sp. IY07-71]BCJ75198.1 hypothetical protein CS0771_47420 [Catellatospora sp. IY07-71]
MSGTKPNIVFEVDAGVFAPARFGAVAAVGAVCLLALLAILILV